MGLWQSFREGGWAMYLIFAFGLTGVGAGLLTVGVRLRGPARRVAAAAGAAPGLRAAMPDVVPPESRGVGASAMALTTSVFGTALAPVLVGVTAAYMATVLLSVTVGGLLGAALPTRALGLGGGVLFLGFAAWTLRQEDDDGDLDDPDDPGAGAGERVRPPVGGTRSIVLSVARAMFVAELGDKTMLATAALAAQGRPVLVWIGATVGITLAGVLVGFRIHGGAPAYLAALVLVLLFAYALSWVVATIGLGAPNGEAAQAAIFPMLFPLTFASSAFVDPSFMPGWLQVFADHQPVTITVDAARDLVLGQPVGWKAAGSVAWSLAILAVFVPLAVRRYRRAT